VIDCGGRKCSAATDVEIRPEACARIDNVVKRFSSICRRAHILRRMLRRRVILA
jgi:hypothetical protein